jgi:2-C-methyl-D-erythritol 4-phosphate cytidylyltransferase/2-C-methyl-D-erythritol 2,4-cyclodiphosphate synthase
MKTVAIIPAGGAGRRLGSSVAKQYLLLDGVPVLARTLKIFQQAKVIDEIVLVVPQDDLTSAQKQLVDKYDLTKVRVIVAGGRQRQDSVRNGLSTIVDRCDVVIVHDGVRPLLTEEMISKVVAAAKSDGASSMGVKVKDTVKQTTDNDLVEATLPRNNLWLTQTPQAFSIDVLRKAHESAASDDFYGTDDASLVERIGGKVKMIAGSYENIKITTSDDLIIAEAFIKNKAGDTMNTRSGFGYDSHRFASGRKLILGGVEIAFDFGLQGHSDADVLIHAICDALLGAAACGDIGRHFPDTDQSYKDISSMILLERVKKIIEEKGFLINNIDATVVMEKPKLAPYAAAMVTNVARTLEIPEADVNIKAKTNEGMGFTGRNEGVAVFATACVTERKTNVSKAQG